MTVQPPEIEASAAGADHAVPAVSLRDVAVHFGAFVAVENMNLTVADREFVSVVGPTGCGKSTLLDVITGLRPPFGGRVEILGQELTDLNGHSGYMLQQDALLPWKTALDNVALGLVFRGTKLPEARDRARTWLGYVGLTGSEHKYPHQLSGGMKKRVALAQIFILNPRIILLDEPFSALDVHTRHLMQTELLRLWAAQDTSVIFVTHDLEEAIALSDRVVVMSAGPKSRVIDSFDITLPRPRNVSEIILNDDFRRIYGSIWDVLRGEVQKTYQRHE